MTEARTHCPALGAALLVGFLLAWMSAVHPAAMPILGPWDFSWLVFLGTCLALWCYTLGLLRTPVAEQPRLLRRAAFFAGLGIIYAVLQTRFEYLALHMFFLNRTQHLVMHHLGPFLIALSWPGETLRRGSPRVIVRLIESGPIQAFLRAVQQPAVAGVLFVGLIILWLTPPVHVRAMLDPVLYTAMNASMVLDGLLFWFLILDPRDRPPARMSFASRLILAIAVQMPQIIAGAAVAMAGIDLYPSYALCGRLFPGIGAVLDQQIGGFIVYFPGAMMSTLAAFLTFRRLWRAEANHQGATYGRAEAPG